MSTLKANGVELYYEESGSGDPVVLVHGSWGNAGRWKRLTPLLSDGYRAIAYDRRGHSRSERPPGQGSIHEDVEDLAGLLRGLDIAPAHVVGNSWGAIISLRCAAAHPELICTLAVHEPPMYGILRDDPEMSAIVRNVDTGLADVLALIEAGRDEEGARTFVNTVAFGANTWEDVFDEQTRTEWTYNAPTFLDECRDPDQTTFDLGSLRDFSKPLLLTVGTESPPMFPAVMARLAAAVPGTPAVVPIEGAGHAPHATHAEPYAALLRAHFASAD
jgi:pimeloyl-ACP methyl ester carboxylesterase